MTLGLILSMSAVLLSAIALALNTRPRTSIFRGENRPEHTDNPTSSDTELLCRVGHELRTPLTSIHGALRLVAHDASGSLSPEAEQLLRVAHENSARMLRLVNDLLDHRRNTEAGVGIDCSETEMSALVELAVRSIAPIVAQKKAPVSSLIEPADALVDEHRCVQVLVNILSNAVSFTPPGGDITITGCHTSEGYEIAVDDGGPGVPEADRDRIFEPYCSLRSHRDGAAGAGLGLTISGQIMRAHGGKIRVESSPSGGARFVMMFPRSVLIETVRAAG